MSMADERLACIVLAAGESKRMKSATSKALHALCGVPLLSRVLRTLAELEASPVVVVVAPDAADVMRLAEAHGAVTCVQPEPLGTGHATLQAADLLEGFAGTVLLTCVDIPLLRAETLTDLVERHRSAQAAATILTAEYEDPTGYGRIVRGADGSVAAIVEHRDADEQTRSIREINSSVYCFRSPLLFELARQIGSENEQGEQYLTDVIEMMVERGERVEAVIVEEPQEIAGINDRVQLAEAERVLRDRTRERLMREGVTLVDPPTVYIDDEVAIGCDTVVWPCTFILGDSAIGCGCTIGPHATIDNCRVGDRVQILHGSLVRDSQIGNEAQIGPFAHIRQDSRVDKGARAASFVELKNAEVGKGTKITHFSYLGDAVVGPEANVGAGAVTCNYDGFRKHRTIIGKGAFIGTNASLVAPLKVGDGAYIGAGSTITKDVPAGALAVGRAKQKIIPDWAEKRRERERTTEGRP
jgi:bifunctional UDP-N-acetylglucosamine pyrophosphorylase/glucosamine-1-phosphate N-acetyltransferase